MGPRHMMEWCLGTPPQHKVPNLSPGSIPELDRSYLKRFVNICQKYGLDSQKIINLTRKGRLPALAQKRSREGSIAAWCTWHRHLRIRVEVRGGSASCLTSPSLPQIIATISHRRTSQAFWYVNFDLQDMASQGVGSCTG